MKNVGLKRVPEFIEEDFIIAVERVLSNAAYPHYYIEISRVSQDEEREVGYDGVLTSIIPFYLQFKRSTFHQPQFRGKTARDRAACGHANRSGFFSFTLYKDRKTRGYDQHNKLYALSQQFTVAYVAPLFYKKDALSHFKLLVPDFAWTYDDVEVVIATSPHTSVILRNARILHETMTIPPHTTILDHLPSHEYSYSHNGDICFHSTVTSVDVPRKTLYDLVVDVLRKLTQEQTPRSLEVSKMAVKLLADVFATNWESRSFRSMLKSYLVELDMLPATWNGNLLSFLLEEVGTMERLLLSEFVLWHELRVVQYVARMKMG